MRALSGVEPVRTRQPSEGKPLASVVIPVFNAASTLHIQLQALANQIGAPPFEVIVADNGSTDGSQRVAEGFRGCLDLRLVDASACRGPSHARNVGARVASTGKLLFCDADDRVAAGWVEAMYEALSFSPMVTGPVIYVDAALLGMERTDLPRVGSAGPRRYLEQIPFAPSNNLALSAELMRRLGGFDRDLRCCEDADLTIRAQYAGQSLAWAPNAIVFNGRRESSAQAARQFFRYGYYDAMLYRKLRGKGLSQRTFWQLLRPYLALAATPYRLLTRRRRLSWVINASQRAGRLVGSVRFGVLCP